jgi:hypothetical protein
MSSEMLTRSWDILSLPGQQFDLLADLIQLHLRLVVHRLHGPSFDTALINGLDLNAPYCMSIRKQMGDVRDVIFVDGIIGFFLFFSSAIID